MLLRKIFHCCVAANFVLFTLWYLVGQLILLPLKLSVFPSELYSRVESRWCYICTSTLLWWYERVMGLKVVITGDRPAKMDRKNLRLVISNHVAYTDWFTMFFLAFHLGHYNGLLRWIVKEGALKIPLLGWCMQLREFIALKRNFKDDFSALQRGVEGYLRRKVDAWLTIYPEGTFVDGTGNHEQVVQAAKEFCRQEGMEELKYTLVPRWKGLSTIVNSLPCDEEGKVVILDLTLAFTGRGYNSALPLTSKHRKLPNPLDFLTGTGPNEVHIHCREWHVQKEDVKTQLYACWQAKDKLLEEFSGQKLFPGTNITRTAFSWQPILFAVLTFVNFRLVTWLFRSLVYLVN